MPKKDDALSTARNKLTQEALAILRETRSRMNPELLSVIRELITGKKMPLAVGRAEENVKSVSYPDAPLSPDLSSSFFSPLAEETPEKTDRVSLLQSPDPRPSVLEGDAKSHKIKSLDSFKKEMMEDKRPAQALPDREPVDREKITEIVLRYMKIKDSGRTKH